MFFVHDQISTAQQAMLSFILQLHTLTQSLFNSDELLCKKGDIYVCVCGIILMQQIPTLPKLSC